MAGREGPPGREPARGGGRAGRGGGRGGFGRGPPAAPPKGLSRTQKELLRGLDKMRAPEPPDFVVVRSPPSSRAGHGKGEASDTAKAKQQIIQGTGISLESEADGDDALDGSRFWHEASGWSQDVEEDDEVEEEGEQEEGGPGGATPEPEAETEAERALRDLYRTAGRAPPRFFDAEALRVRAAPGRGRGVVAAVALEPGRLLAVSAPLDIVFCEEGTTPENEELADTLISKYDFPSRPLHVLLRVRFHTRWLRRSRTAGLDGSPGTRLRCWSGCTMETAAGPGPRIRIWQSRPSCSRPLPRPAPRRWGRRLCRPRRCTGSSMPTASERSSKWVTP